MNVRSLYLCQIYRLNYSCMVSSTTADDSTMTLANLYLTRCTECHTETTVVLAEVNTFYNKQGMSITI
jgi:hypothetical protein